MKKMQLPRMNIRRKVTIGLLVCLLAMGTIAYVSYSNLVEIEQKVHLVESADDLSNIILEIRRYEKNYLLYGHAEDLEENMRYIEEGLRLAQDIAPLAVRMQAERHISLLRNDLLAYSGILDAFSSGSSPADEKSQLDRLRDIGKRLVDQSRELVKFERQRILSINQDLRTGLLLSITLLLGVGTVLIYFINRQVVRPLRIIEDTTRRIARGQFEAAPVVGSNDEVARVIEAFNRMVVELERRQDQLVQAKKLSSIGTLSSGIAHQLNNPLNNIYTSCQILRSEFGSGLDEYGTKLLNNIDGETFRARDIVKGLLEFSRQQEFTLQPTPIKEILDRSIRLISSQVPAGIKVTATVFPDLVAEVDKQRMQEVFLNLLMNAVQAIEPDQGTIDITAVPSPDGESAVITVQDSGRGIPESIRSQIFDPFYTTKEVGIGTGLGLFIVYGIIQKHGGAISVESEEGKGTRFIIRLPMSHREEARQEEA